MTMGVGSHTAWGVSQSHALRKGYAPARTDNRPLFYDIPPGSESTCSCCDMMGIHMTHRHGSAFMSDPSNPPPGGEPGSVYTICKHHLPNNAVIYDPVYDICTDIKGNKL